MPGKNKLHVEVEAKAINNHNHAKISWRGGTQFGNCFVLQIENETKGQRDLTVVALSPAEALALATDLVAYARNHLAEGN